MWVETWNSLFLISGNYSDLCCTKTFTEKYKANLTDVRCKCVFRDRTTVKYDLRRPPPPSFALGGSTLPISILYVSSRNSSLKSSTNFCTCASSPDLFLKPQVMEPLQRAWNNLFRASHHIWCSIVPTVRPNSPLLRLKPVITSPVPVVRASEIIANFHQYFRPLEWILFYEGRIYKAPLFPHKLFLSKRERKEKAILECQNTERQRSNLTIHYPILLLT